MSKTRVLPKHAFILKLLPLLYICIIIRTSMFWKPQQSPENQTRSVFFLKNSRMSDNSTEIDRSFKLGNSFELDNTIINSNKNTKLSLIRENSSLADGNSKDRVRKEGKGDQIKRKYLSKILINRILNVRQAFKLIQSLPINIFTNSASFKMAKQILMKSKVNVEISVLRTLFFSHQHKNNDSCKLKYIRGDNVFVLPTPNEVDDASKQEETLGIQQLGLEKIIKIANLRMTKAMDLLKKHCKDQVAVFRYFNKLCANYETSVEAAFAKMRQLPTKSISSKIESKLKFKQLKILDSILRNKYSSLLMHSFQILKNNSQRQRYCHRAVAMQIITFAKLRKQQSLRQWMYLSKKAKKEEEVCEEKKQALRRIVSRNYLKLFIEIIRRLNNFQRVARRIGCGSKINEQKSFWRLFVNASKDSKY